MTNTTKRALFLRKFAALTSYAALIGVNFIVTTFYRSPEDQQKKFDEGTSKCDGYTKKSHHQNWLAIDIVLVVNHELEWNRTEDYELLGAFWRSLGGIWGGDWVSLNDIYHFQYA